MVRINDHLINESLFSKIVEHEIDLDNGKITVGVRDNRGITWQEKKKLANDYFDLQIENKSGTINLEKGDMARYMAFIKYLKDDDGVHQISKAYLLQLPSEIINQIEKFIPSLQDLMEGISGSLKKK
jgi:hypothetical protein